MSVIAPLPKALFELEFNQGSIYEEDDRAAILRVFDAKCPSCGSEVLAFESEFASSIDAKYAIAVGNCTQGLEIAMKSVLLATESTQRDEVIVPAISWISTASSAALAGAKVKFADVVDPTVCVSIASIQKLVTPKTAAVVVVHLYGRPVDGLQGLATWLRERSIYLIEDCAHAVGSVYGDGTRCGTMGDISVFSFHQQKNMVTLGEGGMCVTSDAQLRERMIGLRSLCAKSYDPKGKYLAISNDEHPMGKLFWLMDFADHGHNFRMTDMQAAVGRAQLKRLPGWNTRRFEIAQTLHAGLSSLHPGLICADVNAVGPNYVHTWHLFHVLITDEFPLPKEDVLWILLHEFGIKAWNHYSPMHLATSFRSRGLGNRGDCPVAEALFEQYISLPLHPRLTDAAVAYMIDAMRQLASRPHVSRVGRVTLLESLLALTKGPAPSKEGSDDVVEVQWNIFKPQVYAAVGDIFQSATTILVSRAPGRLDLMGGNDDYTGGLVFECAIAEATFVAAQSNSDSYITIRNRQVAAADIHVPINILYAAAFETADARPPAVKLADYLRNTFPDSRWPLYVVGVLLWLQLRFPSLMFKRKTGEDSGLSLLIWTQVPLNRGVSSSASVEVAVMKAAARAFGISLSGELLATACQWAENQVCSSACGLMDQMAVTLGTPFMAMQCQPAVIKKAPPLPTDLMIFAVDSGVSHEVSGIEYEAARAAAFMGYKIICSIEGLEVARDMTSVEIPRFTDAKYNGYLANLLPSEFARKFEFSLPESISGQEFLTQFGEHVDPATPIIPEHIYHVRANTRYAVLENNRVTLFSQLLRGCLSDSDVTSQHEVYKQLGELMYQSHDSYTECGLGSNATSVIVDLVRAAGPSQGLFGAKITGGGAGGTVAVLGLASAQKVFEKNVVEAYAAVRGLAEKPYVFVGSSCGADTFGVRELLF